jgi:hypothetical protein
MLRVVLAGEASGVVLVGKTEALGIGTKFTIEVEAEPPCYWSSVTVLPSAPPWLIARGYGDRRRPKDSSEMWAAKRWHTMTDGGRKMNVRCLPAGGMIALLGAAWAPSACAQNGREQEAEQVAWPDTRAGRFAKAFFDAHNADGEDALRQFIKQNYSGDSLKSPGRTGTG